MKYKVTISDGTVGNSVTWILEPYDIKFEWLPIVLNDRILYKKYSHGLEPLENVVCRK